MDGWGKLGAAMFGGPDIEGARMQGQAAGADLAHKMARAQRTRDEAIAFERLQKLAAEQGDDMLSAMFGAGVDPRQLSGYNMDNQGIDQRSELWEMMQGGAGVDELNPGLAVLSGKPVAVQKSLGQGVMTRNAYDSSSEPVITDLGQSMIGANDARAGASNAQAAASMALANQRNNPSPGRNPLNWTNPAGDIVDRMFGTEGEGGIYMADPAKVAAFEQWRQQNLAADPRLADGDYALSRWLVEQNKGATPGVPVATQPAATMFGDGSSQASPIDATAMNFEPPPGTWVRLPSGKVVQTH
ncbi:MAG: hypothetical protein ACK5LJ_17895 [Paracoccus sp. (in: a-proteobacteria)]